jgi:hypothetical protein
MHISPSVYPPSYAQPRACPTDTKTSSSDISDTGFSSFSRSIRFLSAKHRASSFSSWFSLSEPEMLVHTTMHQVRCPLLLYANISGLSLCPRNVSKVHLLSATSLHICLIQKCIGTLVGFGGIDGLLGTNPDTGLVTNTQYVQSSESSHKLNRADKHVFSATIEDKRWVYGENIPPTRITRTLLRLMWTALKDKDLVSNSFVVCPPAQHNSLVVDRASDCCLHLLSAAIVPRLCFCSRFRRPSC